MKIFSGISFYIFLIQFAENIDCGYTLEPPRRGGSNEYPQFMFWSKNKKNRYTPFCYIKVGCKGDMFSKCQTKKEQSEKKCQKLSKIWNNQNQRIVLNVHDYRWVYMWHPPPFVFPHQNSNIKQDD